jgi:hypothetical protein
LNEIGSTYAWTRGIDAILTVAIIDVKAERYVRPETKLMCHWLTTTGLQTIITERKHWSISQAISTLQARYFLETKSLRSEKAGKLVWSGRSYVFDPQDVERFVPKYAKKLFKEMLTAGIIDK